MAQSGIIVIQALKPAQPAFGQSASKALVKGALVLYRPAKFNLPGTLPAGAGRRRSAGNDRSGVL